MKIIHQNGYTTEELQVFRLVVYKNLVESAQAIVQAMRKLGVDCAIPANRAHAEAILAFRVPSSDSSFTLNPDLATAIEEVWRDPIIAEVMDHSSEFYLMDSAP